MDFSATAGNGNLSNRTIKSKNGADLIRAISPRE
jgi:hypothetical protein